METSIFIYGDELETLSSYIEHLLKTFKDYDANITTKTTFSYVKITGSFYGFFFYKKDGAFSPVRVFPWGSLKMLTEQYYDGLSDFDIKNVESHYWSIEFNIKG